MAKTYSGPVAFGSDGVHYPVSKDGEMDTGRPLRYDTVAGVYRDAEAGEELHNDAHHAADLELPVGGE